MGICAAHPQLCFWMVREIDSLPYDELTTLITLLKAHFSSVPH